ncbi:hypothetical protein [Pseudoxanthomonas sacheonensis]|uniref:hypothetical protein n=1 Tax=Pseudoxanthomonas sacheonensis TaxID=443615 RepID=UPI0013D4668F|nr:hypothetical protein [Pseudoxanthomonas sacheonensis]KAF1705916.1 hypothetical protein CSC73_18000 [Pseudoxanthomonas sacheonensis]
MLSRWAALALLCVVVAADATEVQLDVGGTRLRYEQPAGYVRVSEESPTLFRYLESAMPPANRLVEAFYTPADIQILLAGGEKVEDTYFMVQSIRMLENQTVSTADWRQVLSQASAEMGRFDVNAEVARDATRDKRMSHAAGQQVQMEFGKIVTPQVYSQNDNEVRFLMLIPVTVSVEGQPLSINGVCAGAMLLVRNKPLLVYAYRATSTAADVTAAKQQLAVATDALLSLNASSADVATSPGAKLGRGLDWSRIAVKAAIGAGISLLICLLVWMRNRRNQGS